MNPPPLPPRPNPVARFFVGLWDVMNFTRRLILNLLFFGLLLLVLIVFLAAVGKGSGVAPVHERTTLVIAPEGRLVEQYTTDPLTRAVAHWATPRPRKCSCVTCCGRSRPRAGTRTSSACC